MKNFYFSLSLFFFFSANAQVNLCGTKAFDTEFLKLYSANLSHKNLTEQATTRLPLTQVPVHIHHFKSSTGAANISITQIRAELDSVNKLYVNAGIYFYECYPPQTIMVDSLYNYSINDEHIVLNNYYTSGCLNIYFHNNINAGSAGNVCGYSDYPPGQDYVFIAAACGKNGSTLAHEIGHYFGVVHTHDRINGTYEMVNGSNCATAGDKLCDTPADPNLSGKVNNSCVYIGGAVDQNNTPYNPNTTLVMSYSNFACRANFSPMQYALINQTLINNRSYLNCTNTSNIQEISSHNVLIYPNPVNKFLNIKLSNLEIVNISIYDVHGKLMFQEKALFTDKIIDVSKFKNGYYFIKIEMQEAVICKPVIIISD